MGDTMIIQEGRKAIDAHYRKGGNTGDFYRDTPLSSVQTAQASYVGTVIALRQAGLMA